MFPSSSSNSLTAKRRSLFRFSLGNMADTDSPVQLTAFNGVNGDHSVNGLGEILQKNGSAGTLTKNEIRGPTGTVRGFKNMIKQRKECLRMSTIASKDEVRWMLALT